MRISIPVEMEGNMFFVRSEQDTTSQNFQVSSNSQQYSAESVETFRWKDNKARIKVQAERHEMQ